MPKTLPTGIYGVTAEKFSQGRSNLQVVKEMIRGGVTVIQYREKHAEKSIREIFEARVPNFPNIAPISSGRYWDIRNFFKT